MKSYRFVMAGSLEDLLVSGGSRLRGNGLDASDQIGILKRLRQKIVGAQTEAHLGPVSKT